MAFRIVHSPLSAVHYPLSTIHYSLFTIDHSLPLSDKILGMRFLIPLILIAAGCSSSPPSGPAANDRPAPATATSGRTEEAGTVAEQSPTPKDEAPAGKDDFEGTTGIIDKRKTLAASATLKAIRTGRHEGFDRIVFEFAGEEVPGYHVEYIDKPVRACGSGDVVPLAGDGWLQVRFEPARAHTDEGKPTLGSRELAPRLPNLLVLKSTCDFEGQVEWVAGVGSPNGYRVLELEKPSRFVVDIKHK